VIGTVLPLWWPESAAELARHHPSAEEWEAELESGWSGPNGSTCSTDDIEGIRIGRTTREYAHPLLPADHHDYDYRVQRRLAALRQIDGATRREMRAAADRKHYAGLLHKLLVLVGWSGWKARRRARVRYLALRLFGWRFNRVREDEAFRTERHHPGAAA
jgi:hypothetical protein